MGTLALVPPVEAATVLSALHIREATLHDTEAILELHGEAFADKFGGAFGSQAKTRGRAALAMAWQRQGSHALRGMFVAEWRGTIIGTTTLRTWEMGNDDMGATELAFQQVLGLWGATRSMFALSLLSHRIERDEGFITDVAVLLPFQGCGVATTLLGHAADEARRQARSYLSLYVSGSNRKARNLYQQLGFHLVRVRRSWLTRLIFGQREWMFMRKDLM